MLGLLPVKMVIMGVPRLPPMVLEHLLLIGLFFGLLDHLFLLEGPSTVLLDEPLEEAVRILPSSSFRLHGVAVSLVVMVKTSDVPC